MLMMMINDQRTRKVPTHNRASSVSAVVVDQVRLACGLIERGGDRRGGQRDHARNVIKTIAVYVFRSVRSDSLRWLDDQLS